SRRRGKADVPGRPRPRGTRPRPPDPCRLQAARPGHLLHRRRQGSPRLDHPPGRHRTAGGRRHPHRLRTRLHPRPDHRFRRLHRLQGRGRRQGSRQDARRRQGIRGQGWRRPELPVQRLGSYMTPDTPGPADAVDNSPKLSLEVLWRAYEQSHEAVLVSDGKNRIIAVNAAFTRLTGYSAAEALGQNPSILASGNAGPEFYAAMWEGISQYDFWEGEIWDKRKDGSLYPKWLCISVLRDANGQVGNYVANFTDISASKQAADRLAQLAYHDALTHLPNRLAFEAQ